MRSILIALALSALTACGTPAAGDSCNTEGFLCSDAKTALECRVGSWQAIPCRGPTGCARTDDVVNCDLNGALENDACASTAEGRGLCTPDGRGTLECQQGKFVRTNSCSSCSVTGDVVTCAP